MANVHYYNSPENVQSDHGFAYFLIALIAVLVVGYFTYAYFINNPINLNQDIIVQPQVNVETPDITNPTIPPATPTSNPTTPTPTPTTPTPSPISRNY